MNNTDNVEVEYDENEKLNYKDILESVRLLQNTANDLKANVDSYILDNLNLSTDILIDILKHKMDEILNMSREDIISYLNKFKNDTNTTDYNNSSDTELKEIIKSIKESSMLVVSTNAEAENMKKEATELIDEYVDYTTNNTDKRLYDTTLSNLVLSLKSETIDSKRKEIEKKIDVLTKSENYSYIEERLAKYKDKEIKSIIDILFNNKQGAYVKNRFLNNIKKLGYSTEIYKYFFNIEENFLPEEYHMFNNLFMFIYMRYIAYVDVYDSASTFLGRAFTGSMSKLIYHRFRTTEQEQDFLNFIKHIEDTYFGDYRDYFIENNTLYKNHPQMIEQRKEFVKKLKEETIFKIKQFDSEAVVDETKDVDELIKDLNDLKNKIESEALSDYREYIAEQEKDTEEEVTESEDSTEDASKE